MVLRLDSLTGEVWEMMLFCGICFWLQGPNFLKKFFLYFLEIGEGRERDFGSVASHMCSDWGPNLQPRRVP